MTLSAIASIAGAMEAAIAVVIACIISGATPEAAMAVEAAFATAFAAAIVSIWSSKLDGLEGRAGGLSALLPTVETEELLVEVVRPRPRDGKKR